MFNISLVLIRVSFKAFKSRGMYSNVSKCNAKMFVCCTHVCIKTTITSSVKDTVPRRYFFFGSFMFFCLAFAMPLCASVYMCLVVTCWERTDLVALFCGV